VAFIGRSAGAQQPPPCDFLTGGGFIITSASGTHPDAKANLAIGGGCKGGFPTWGHLEYHDKGNGLKTHWTSITAYMFEGTTGVDPQTGQPTGTRIICGTASTNLYGNVDFRVKAKDAGEPGTFDQFDIRLTQGTTIVYTTEAGTPSNRLGGGQGGGGNIQLHKPNPSTSGSFGGSCPAASAGQQTFTLTVTKTGTAAASSTVSSNPPGIACDPTCSFAFTAGTQVMLTVTTGTGNNTTWTSGCDTGTANNVPPGTPPPTCTVTMSANKTVAVQINFPE
jgi:hypothetical protein